MDIGLALRIHCINVGFVFVILGKCRLHSLIKMRLICFDAVTFGCCNNGDFENNEANIQNSFENVLIVFCHCNRPH